MTQAQGNLPPRFGRYTILSQLGVGGMATVYKAEMRSGNQFTRLVALKVMNRNLLSEPEMAEGFIREARLGGQLSHPNLVAAMDSGEVDGVPFLAMEFVEGPTLHDVITTALERNVYIPLPIILTIFSQICQGLEYLHHATDHNGKALTLVHRDIKPPNLFLSRFGVVKIGDFGVARSASVTGEIRHSTFIKGTFAYMSPEQAWGEENLDGRSDIFALGAVLYEALTRQRLYEGEKLEVLIRAAQDVQIEPRLKLVPNIPMREDVLQVLRRALCPRREERYQNAGDMGADLDAMLRCWEIPPRLGPWLQQWEGGTGLNVPEPSRSITAPRVGGIPRTPLQPRSVASELPQSGPTVAPGPPPPVETESGIPVARSQEQTWVGDASEYGLLSRRPAGEDEALASFDLDDAETELGTPRLTVVPVATPTVTESAPPSRSVVLPLVGAAGAALAVVAIAWILTRAEPPQVVAILPEPTPQLMLATPAAITPAPTVVSPPLTPAPVVVDAPADAPAVNNAPRKVTTTPRAPAPTPVPAHELGDGIRNLLNTDEPEATQDDPPPRPSAKGFLTLDFRPDITVTVDGKLETSQQRRKELPAGSHTLKVTRQDGTTQTLFFDIKGGVEVLCSFKGLRQTLGCG